MTTVGLHVIYNQKNRHDVEQRLNTFFSGLIQGSVQRTNGAPYWKDNRFLVQALGFATEKAPEEILSAFRSLTGEDCLVSGDADNLQAEVLHTQPEMLENPDRLFASMMIRTVPSAQ